jgi:macrolide-specific efflux system membrane fusion protein
MRVMKAKFSAGVLLATCLTGAAFAQEIKVPGALVKLIDQLDVPAREAGQIVQLDVQEGARVKAGEVLARLDDTEARFAEQRAKVELQIAGEQATSDIDARSAQRSLMTAEMELKRAEDARQRLRDLVTETEIDKLRLNADQAKLALEKAQHELAVARLQQSLKKVEADFATQRVARRSLSSPFPGVVVQVFKHAGEWAEPGDKVLRVIRLDRLRVEGFLEAAQAAGALEGRPVTLTVDLPGKPAASFSGKLTFVSPEIDPFNRSVRVLAEIDNPQSQLKPGLRGTLTIRP